MLTDKLMKHVEDIVREQLKAKQGSLRPMYQPERRSRNQGRREMSKVRCHNCRLFGHFAASCPNASENEGQRSRSPSLHRREDVSRPTMIIQDPNNIAMSTSIFL